MTKFGDKLQRLHGSRVRALDSNQRNEGVFVADVEEKQPKNEPSQNNDRKFASLLRNQSLKGKSKSKRPKSASDFGAYTLKPEQVITTAQNHKIGDRVKDLRIQATALIDAGRHESALPLLFEIVAFVPENNFALAKLASYFKQTNQAHLANIFETRLKKIANY